MSEPMRDAVELLSPENLKVVEDCIDMGKDDGDIATIHIDRLQAVLDGYKAALAANREKDAKIVQLRGLLASQDGAMEENCRLRSELASLRASVGDRWDTFGCNKPAYGEVVEVLFSGPCIALCHLEQEELADDDMRIPQDILWDDNGDQERTMAGVYWRKFAPPTKDKE